MVGGDYVRRLRLLHKQPSAHTPPDPSSTSDVGSGTTPTLSNVPRSATVSLPNWTKTTLSIALRLRPDVIFVLTDGGDPPLSSPEMELLTRENDGRTAIHCVHFGSGPLQDEDNFLRRLAARNSGGYAYVDMMGGR